MTDADRSALACPAVRNYLFFSFAALLGMVVVLVLKGMDLWCVFPLVLGALSLLANWKAGPVFVLVSLTIMVTAQAHGFDPVTCLQMSLHYLVHLAGAPPLTGMSFVRATPILDGLLAACVLAYLVGHYRLQALVYYIVPPEGRTPAALGKTSQPAPHAMNPRRGLGPIGTWELPLLTLTAVVCALAGDFVRSFLFRLRPAGGAEMSEIGWRTLMFIWLSALILLSAWATFGYIGRMCATHAESILYLQDQLWLETRRDQGRISRWLAWVRLHGQRRREDKS
jgi:hypothetical protein